MAMKKSGSQKRIDVDNYKLLDEESNKLLEDRR